MPNPLNELPFTENYPQPLDITAFNKELTRIFGKEEMTGRPWVRVIWAAAPLTDRDEYGVPTAFTWDMYGKGGEGEWRRTYLYASSFDWLEVPDRETGLFVKHKIWTDIAPPRFVIERFIPPSMALSGWVASGRDRTGDKWTDRRPTHGLYEALMFPPSLLAIAPRIATGVIAEHNGYCCEQASKERLMCYGQYAEPGQVHLDEFARIKYLLNREKEDRPGEMTAEQWEAARKRSRERDAGKFTRAEANLDLAIRDFWRTHKSQLTDDVSVNQHGKFHWVSGHNKSGTPAKILPNDKE